MAISKPCDNYNHKFIIDIHKKIIESKHYTKR